MAAMAALAGCTAPISPELKPSLPSQWRHAPPRQAARPTDLHGWWHAFGDRGLDRMVDQALANNLDVAQAVERLRAARERHDHVGAQFLPQLHGKTVDAIDPDASASFFVAGLDSVWELGLFGRRDAERQLSQATFDGAVADLHSVRVSLVAEVVRDWLQLHTAQRRAVVLTRIRDARRHQLDLLRVQQRLHLAPAASVSQAQANLAEAEAALLEPQQAVDANAQRLAVLLGRNEPDPHWLQSGSPPELGALRIDAAPADLLRSRPEIAHAEAEVLRAAGEAGLARADRYPSVGIGGSLVWSTNLTTHRRTSDNALASVGPMIDIPLFDWGMRASEARAKRHELMASVLAYRQAVLRGVAEAETALGGLARQHQRERQRQAVVRALRRIDTITAKRVSLALASPQDRQESTINLDQAVLALDDAREARGLAYIALFKALGGAPLPEPSGQGQAQADLHGEARR